MRKRKSKAARIRELYERGLGSAEIAKRVGCKQEYVRVAGRQRNAPGGKSAAQIKYEAANPDYVERRTRKFAEDRTRWHKTPEGRAWVHRYNREVRPKLRAAKRQNEQQAAQA